MEYFSKINMLDEKDFQILEVLKQNSKFTTQQIAKKINIPITTIHNRIKKLEKLSIIKGYTVVMDYKQIGKGILAYVLVTVNYLLPSGKKITQESIAKNIKKLSGVEEVDIMTGVIDILVKVRLKDIDELNDFVIDRLREIDGIDKTQTMIVLSSV